ncbi:MAG: acetyl-CoA carboxylase carboxyltransferase subunit beta [Clostridia bacterium]|nr:acetyl-CoA carboxylase carboxyltransferase subunit beta [Clostridia bacterium]
MKFTKNMFIKPRIELEGQKNAKKEKRDFASLWKREERQCCPGCRRSIIKREMEENSFVCPLCGRHFRLDARQRIEFIADEGSFTELFGEISACDPLAFPQYAEKLEKARRTSGEKEGVITGTCRIGGIAAALISMEANFMMGSMSAAVGEKITLLFEYAKDHRLPVIAYTVSGGARVQEGMLSLMQMAKTSGAVKRHSEAGLLYIAVLTDPTTGGVTASFAMEGDIILAEPGALIGFAGPRVIEQTMRQNLPKGFQRTEFLLEKGFIDKIVPRREQRETLIRLLSLHRREDA